MSGAVTAAAVTAVLGGVIYGCVFWWAFRRARRTYSRAIVRRLQQTGQQVEIKVSDRRGTWNPARKEVAGRLFANGRAVYSLDASGVVHLEFHPVAGAQQDYEGPIPTWHDSPEGRRRRRFMRRLWVGYTAWLLIGFVVGYLVAQGSEGKHLVLGVVGLFVAMILASVATTALRVGMAVRSTVQDRPRSK